MMRHNKVGFGIAVLVVLLSAVLGGTVLREPIASAASPFENVIVGNTPSQPVPVKQQGIADVREALWQGTPYLASIIVTGVSSFQCGDVFPAIPAGKVLFVERVVTDFNVPHGKGGSASLRLTLLGDSDFSPTIVVPAHPATPVHQVAGEYDGYSGSLEIGLPTSVTPQACFGTIDDLKGKTTVIGYLVNAS